MNVIEDRHVLWDCVAQEALMRDFVFRVSAVTTRLDGIPEILASGAVHTVFFNPFSASSSGMQQQQLLVPAVFLSLAPNVQSLSLNARNFLISQTVLSQCSCRIK